MEYQEIKEQIIEITKQPNNTIKKIVAQEALIYSSGDIRSFFSDLFNNGCISGMVGCLIYYKDTHKFFQDHYDEIERLRIDYELNTGITLEPKGDLINWYAWLAFEMTARELAAELGIL